MSAFETLRSRRCQPMRHLISGLQGFAPDALVFCATTKEVNAPNRRHPPGRRLARLVQQVMPLQQKCAMNGISVGDNVSN